MAKVTEEEAAKLRSNFSAASTKLRAGLKMATGGSAAENDYSTTYQALVAAGLAPQIRRKYR